jgi:IS5 family transposase
MIDLRHPLCVLSSRMPWQQIEASVSHLFMRKARAAVAGVASENGKNRTLSLH